MNTENLTDKIKKGIIKSGFPLEMKIGALLEKELWYYSIGDLYKDFETDKIREIDIYAQRIINEISIHLYIACKKSTDRQLILYSPTINKEQGNLFASSYFTTFPKIKYQEGYDPQKIYSTFSGLDFFKRSIPISKKLLVSQGDKITEDNVKFLSDFNGLVKNSIIRGSIGYADSGLRVINLYIMVFDGAIYNLTPSENQDFELSNCDYGCILYEPNIRLSQDEYVLMNPELRKTQQSFNSQFVIEVMTPTYFSQYLQRTGTILEQIQSHRLEGWGKAWPRRLDEGESPWG